MNEAVAYPLVFLSAAALTDTKTGTIPNLLILFGAFPALFIVGNSFLLRFFLGVLILFPLFFFRFFGAGDIKLCALVVGWIGWHAFLPQLFLGFLAASVPALILFLRKKHEKIPMAPFFLTGFVLYQIVQNQTGGFL